MSNKMNTLSSKLGGTQITHIDGVAWHEAKRPFPLHKCRAQTFGYIGLSEVQRCACGAIRNSQYRNWMRKNERWGKKLLVLTGVIGGIIAVIGLAATFLFF